MPLSDESAPTLSLSLGLSSVAADSELLLDHALSEAVHFPLVATLFHVVVDPYLVSLCSFAAEGLVPDPSGYLLPSSLPPLQFVPAASPLCTAVLASAQTACW